MTLILLGIAVFLGSASIDFANARYVQAVSHGSPHKAARWSVIQWVASLVGFLVAVKCTLWVLPAEMLGLYVGSVLALTTYAKTAKGTPADCLAVPTRDG